MRKIIFLLLLPQCMMGETPQHHTLLYECKMPQISKRAYCIMVIDTSRLKGQLYEFNCSAINALQIDFKIKTLSDTCFEMEPKTYCFQYYDYKNHRVKSHVSGSYIYEVKKKWKKIEYNRIKSSRSFTEDEVKIRTDFTSPIEDNATLLENNIIWIPPYMKRIKNVNWNYIDSNYDWDRTIVIAIWGDEAKK